MQLKNRTNAIQESYSFAYDFVLFYLVQALIEYIAAYILEEENADPETAKEALELAFMVNPYVCEVLQAQKNV